MASREWASLPSMVQGQILSQQSEIPIRVSEIARTLGLEVKAATLEPGISGELRSGEAGLFIIKVNRHESKHRQRFTVAHEIAHFLLHRDEIQNGIKDDVLYRSALSDAREAEANRLAADILMPYGLVKQAKSTAEALGVEDVVLHLAERFQVSEAAMRIRIDG